MQKLTAIFARYKAFWPLLTEQTHTQSVPNNKSLVQIKSTYVRELLT